ncbi:MAG: nucleotidyltransferase family protein [Bacteroidales bacterium]|nr:nucleotidyltransferase family protein [Bacteroidales bacterium]
MLTKNKILQILQEKKELLTQYGVKRIGLFGSYSKNSQHKNSDIDILVDFYSEQETFDNLMTIYDILENTFKNNKIEIVTKNGLSKYIGSYILKETEYV